MTAAVSPDGGGAGAGFCRRLVTSEENSILPDRVSDVRYRELRRRCDRHVQALVEAGDLPDPFTLDEFLAKLEARRGRRIMLRPSDYVPGRACGMWLQLTDVDVIVYARTAPLHEEHIVLHEVGHMMCRHRGEPSLGDDIARMLMPDLDPAMVRSLLNRGSYSDIEEQEAELFATLLLERVADRRPAEAAPLDADLAPQMDRLRSTFSE
jgi:hypothetical protein